jgi:hypothetical protein
MLAIIISVEGLYGKALKQAGVKASSQGSFDKSAAFQTG